MTVVSRLWAGVTVALAMVLSPAPALAGKKPKKVYVPGMLWGVPSTPPPAPVERDPWLPSGVPLASPLARPEPGGEPPACSTRAPVCVHRGPKVSAQTALDALSALETAYERLVLALALPAPLPDQGRGGSDALDLYLDASPAPLATGHDPPALVGFDAASAFCTLGTSPLIDRDATLCVAEAIAWRLAPATTPYLRRAYATHLWLAVGYPTFRDAEAVDDVQANPQLGIAGREVSRLAEGAAIFDQYLEDKHGGGVPTQLATALLSAAATRTPPGAFEWEDDPDVFDALRHSFGEDTRRMADMMGDFAVSRAFIGSRGDGSVLPSLDWTGAFGRVRFDWSIPLSSLPRNVAALHPIDPTGSIYIWLSLDKVPENKTLAFRAQWELPVSFKWELVRVGHDGSELSRIDVSFEDNATVAERRVVNLQGAAGIVIVGTNMGGVDLDHPFDPDVAPYEPHSCSVYLVLI